MTAFAAPAILRWPVRAFIQVLPLALLLGCPRADQGGSSSEPLATLSDATGAPQLTLRKAEPGVVRYHTRDSRDGVLRNAAAGLTVEGDLHATALVRRADGAWLLQRTKEPSLELRREPTGLRLGDAQGIPLGRVRLEGVEALLFDAGGRVLVRARQEGGRMLIRDREGAVTGYATGVDSPERVALTSHPVLSPGERAALLTMPDLP